MTRGIQTLCFGTLGVALAGAATAQPVSESRTWTERFPVADEAELRLENIWGDVIVVPGQPGELVLEIAERRSAPDQQRFDRSLEVLPVRVDAQPDLVQIEVGTRRHHWQRRDPCRGCRVDVDFRVTVPPEMALEVSTVNDGVVDVRGIGGLITARNVNGPVTVIGAHGCDEIGSVNGTVALSFPSGPASDCTIETVNGDIRLIVPDDRGLDLALNLTHGRVVSELPAEAMAFPAEIEQTTNNGRHQYRVTQPAGLRLAGGGATLFVTSLNGDVRVVKQ